MSWLTNPFLDWLKIESVKKMSIIYPPLVEQMYKFMRQAGMNVTKQDVYKKAIEANMIDQQGNPTKWAIEQGYIAEVPTAEEAQDKLNKIKPTAIRNQVDNDLNTVFHRMPKSAFIWIESEGSYAINQHELKKAILSALKDGSLSSTGRQHWLEVLAKIKD
ncbi:hypothetical protein [Lactobacillus johnsonii]|uniref:hypothetical protein n=2 Tax=Lactobacillus johnsonii TaxID=33959 RepID=UPI000A9711B2|nr:hypothetical protein [Lactobacillus johnsonii]